MHLGEAGTVDDADPLMFDMRLGTPPDIPVPQSFSEPDSGYFDADEDDGPRERRSLAGGAAAILAVIAALAWVGGMLWLALPRLRAPIDVIDLTQFIAALCVPPALIGILWLLAMRTSRTEAKRFAATSAGMRAEAAALERSIAQVSAQIAANQAALGNQIATLVSAGDNAASRLATIGSAMAQEVAQAEEHSRVVTTTANEARDALSVLLATLPRAYEDVRLLSVTMEGTGLLASERANALNAQVVSLGDRIRAADDLASGAAQRLAAHITRMDATSETAGTRLENVTAEMSNAVDDLLGRTSGAVEEARKGIAAQGEAMLAMIEANQAALTHASRDSAEALASRIAAIEEAINRIASRLDEQRVASDTLIAKIDRDFAAVETRVADFHSTGVERNQTLAASISALGGSADAMTEALKAGEDMARRVINTSEDLLTSLDAAAREIDETLPDALTRLDTKIGASRAVVASAKPELLALVTAAESTHDAIEAIAQVIQGQRTTLDQLSANLVQALASGREQADSIGTMLDQTIARTHDFAEEAAPRLVDALLRVRETANAAADRARETLATVIPEAARALEQASVQAMQRATGNAIDQQVAAIAGAAEGAVEAATRASERLTQQMTKIAETTALVEQRLEEARAEREQADTESFGRRASLLIEALNSVSIDIAKNLSGEVSDSAWAAYLKGDRGVFTRRAVRLLDAGNAREILRLYDSDPVFREQVNRYIHDFEAMLRGVLAQRDGSPMGVTLLSSDMGKLYVALAQAIERLRT